MPKPNTARKPSVDSCATAKNDRAPKPAANSRKKAARSANSGALAARSTRSLETKRKHGGRRRRQPSLERLPIDEALRRGGMGEFEYAKSLGRFMDTVDGAKPDRKLMLDGVKEWGRHFQPKRSSESAPSSDPPVIVQLVHNVQRPARPPLEIPAPPAPPETGA